jgi:hypothetical protein
MSVSIFEERLSGGHPNSLGNTVEVVEEILADTSKLEELYQTYFSEDEVVRLRVSNAWKRIAKEDIQLFIPFLDRFMSEISKIDQASTKWTIANLFEFSTEFMTADQLQKAKEIIKNNLQTCSDWIVRKNSMDVLGSWSKEDDDLKTWLIPELKKLTKDPKKVVPKTAQNGYKF